MTSKRWINEVLNRGIGGCEELPRCILLGDGLGGAGRGCTARMAFALVDHRAVALIFPASRRVVLDRLRKLLGADEVRLAPCDEVDRILEDRTAELYPSLPDLRRISLLMDASLLSARSLEIQTCAAEDPVRLTLEDWLATADPGLGFFTEPNHESN